MAIPPVNSSSSGSIAANDGVGLITNYEAFLQLLTTQLKNQSPLDPMDTNQFTQQLVQFSTVEQAIKTNQNLERLIANAAASNALGLVGYIGTTVTAEGSKTELTGGQAVWQLNAPSEGTAEIAIRNAEGAVVFTDTVAIPQGASHFNWDGAMNTGGIAPDGSYSISITAKNADGKLFAVDTLVNGTVDSIDLSGTEPLLKIGDLTIPLSAVRKVAWQ
jgi:flagellar basal-body rod modification protein FlgD